MAATETFCEGTGCVPKCRLRLARALPFESRSMERSMETRLECCLAVVNVRSLERLASVERFRLPIIIPRFRFFTARFFEKNMDVIELLFFYMMWCEFAEDADLEYRRSVQRRRRWLYCRRLCNQNGEARHYCQINTTVPVLQRFFGGEDTRPDFRLSREAIQVLLGALETERQHGWGPTLETLVFLFWIASGSAYRVVSRVFGIPITSVHRMVHNIVEEVVAVRHHFIHLPQNQEELQAMGDGFARLAGHPAFSKVAGAIDGSHIRIKCPGGPDGQDYINRKLFPSMVLQAVCDHKGRFIDTYMGYPGSVHDARILRNSFLYVSGNYPPPGYFILGDGGYPCLTEPVALITPYKRPLRNMAEQRFNTHHSRGRSIIERAFGMMKTRFRCIFLEALEVHSEFVPKVVTACAVLHNICIGVGDEVAVEDEAMGDDPPPERECGAESRSGAPWRAALTNAITPLQVAPQDHDYFALPVPQ